MHITDLCEPLRFPPETIRDRGMMNRTERPIAPAIAPLVTPGQTTQPTPKFPITCVMVTDSEPGSIAAPIAP
jgi:hypothetical protein